MVNEIKNIDDFVKAIGDENAGLVVIDFYTSWCGPCKMISPFIVELSKKYTEVGFNKFNCDNMDDRDVAEIVDRCEIRAFPTFLFFKGGECKFIIKGANKQLLESKVQEFLSSNQVKGTETDNTTNSTTNSTTGNTAESTIER
jgi:thiol-disulfide isomerase/thioredoxin